ncbi:MAG TPA: glycosyltransferase family 2 protein [Candidatus Limnocylindrales bacterium]|nr:glycosyltransferase family 2 protein [Candidatus Limnocylindrales bacterium]
MGTPSVSVLIPVYNGERTIAGCIDSVLAQQYPRLEVVVVNDCSTDRTAEILRRYEGRVRVFTNARNSGIAATYNRAIREASGDIVLTVASDCILLSPDYVERMVRHFDDPTVGAVVGKSMMPEWDRAPWLERVFTRLNILDTNCPDTGAHEVNFVELRCDGYRRQLLIDVGGLNEDLFRSNEDQDLSIRIARRGARLLQDNSLEFELGFGGTEDTLGKLLSKQTQYARGQAYIAVNYGVGSRNGLWTNENRRMRAVHRMSQVATLPILVATALVALAWPGAAAAVLAMLLVTRLWWYARLARDLKPAERLAALALGPVCDVLYSFSFWTSAVGWIASGKAAFNRRQVGHLEIARPRA